MLALWLENNSISIRDDLPIPEPTPGEALVKVHLSGICATDLEMVRGYYPFKGVLGHEFVGEVVKAPQNSDWIGKRVVGEINIVCGECDACRAG
ncbi:MAG: alcohol dehydrogenase catalytic domain-containing protein, partial [Anaerolineales bacterium]